MQIPRILLASALLVLLPAAQAQDAPVYKCAGKGQVTYSQVPCAGAKVLGAPAPKAAASREPVSQDRAKLHARAQLAPEVLQQCTELDDKIRDEQEVLKAKGDAVKPSDESTLVRLRLKQKELRC
jgi:hypothetical protein